MDTFVVKISLRANGLWRARLVVNGSHRNVGYFDTYDQAASASLLAATTGGLIPVTKPPEPGYQGRTTLAFHRWIKFLGGSGGASNPPSG